MRASRSGAGCKRFAFAKNATSVRMSARASISGSAEELPWRFRELTICRACMFRSPGLCTDAFDSFAFEEGAKVVLGEQNPAFSAECFDMRNFAPRHSLSQGLRRTAEESCGFLVPKVAIIVHEPMITRPYSRKSLKVGTSRVRVG